MSEKSAVQNPLLRYAQCIGWEYVSPAEAMRLRGGEGGTFFSSVLDAQFRRLNPGIVDGGNVTEVLRRFALLPATIAGNRDALRWLRGEESVFVPGERRERNVRVIDFARPEANRFQVTDEWVQRGVAHRNRADVVFLINGIPVAVCETKAAGKAGGLSEGVEQIRRYHRETPELFTLPQVFEVTQLLDFYYGATWVTSRKGLFNWRDESPDAADYEGRVVAFFDRTRFLKLLRDYIIFLTRDDELTKVILRQHQTRAVERTLERVADPHRRRGLVWHTQGSGKTLTMLTVAARLLRDAPGGEKPTVLLLVDRNELEAQLFQNVSAYGIGTVEVAQSKAELRRILGSDYRGLVVSMIHKFDGADANLNTRAGVTVLVDEAHRTTGGDLGNYLLAALPNATYIGFTGTPIDRLAHGQGTFKVFGPDDPTGYLDKYSIADSITDGTTLRLNYALAPSELRVDRETLDSRFLALADAEGVADVEELNAVLDRAVELKALLKAPERVARIAASVATHFRENVEPLGFKAFLVAVDREACALYKEALDRHLPPDYSRVVISAGNNDGPLLKRHHLAPDDEKALRKAFIRKDTQPKILIVTEKLLTGFDAPILYCLYLDKPMRDHVLLQTIARVNRPYEDGQGMTKPVGFVVDYVGIFERLERALAFDSDVVGAVIQNIDVLKTLFATLMRETAPQYLALATGFDDKAKERAVEALLDKAAREAFFHTYRQIQTLYDILSPDAALRPYIDEYCTLAELYALIRNAYADRTYVDREVTAKTKQLLRAHTTLDRLELPGTIHELGPRELAALRQGDSSSVAQVLNLSKALAAATADGTQPYLLSLGERAAELATRYEDRQVATQEALAAFEQMAFEYVEADGERQRLGLDPNAFAVYRLLAPVTGEAAVAQANEVEGVFARFPDYRWHEGQQSALRSSLYRTLRPLVGAQRMIATTNDLLKLRRV